MINIIIRIIKEYGPIILEGIGTTLLLSLIGTIVGLLISLILGTIRYTKINKYDNIALKILKYIGNGLIKIYVTVIRGTPMIVQALIVFYGLYRLGIDLSPFNAGLLTVSINTGAYLTEVILNGLNSVDVGQEEASRSLGLSKLQTLIFVVFPQALKTQMASIGNEFIINIKDTSVLSVIWVVDLYRALKNPIDDHFWYLESMLLAAAIYLILTYTTSKLLKLFEKRLGAPVKELTSCN